jgi:hypothetical protein
VLLDATPCCGSSVLSPSSVPDPTFTPIIPAAFAENARNEEAKIIDNIFFIIKPLLILIFITIVGILII